MTVSVQMDIREVDYVEVVVRVISKDVRVLIPTVKTSLFESILAD